MNQVDNPIARFQAWIEDAKRHPGIAEPTAMCLATADAAGKPSARMVLLKEADARGFVFYTNLDSRKSQEIKSNPHAALCFYWMPLERQVRVEGNVEPIPAEEADAYFSSRPLESRIGAWASKQSRPLSGKAELLAAVAKETARFAGRSVPRPDFWSGWRIVPNRIEFWQAGAFRLHDREVYTHTPQGWETQRLYP